MASAPEQELEIATTTTPEFDRAVPRGLQVAAAWAWRVILVAALIYGLGRLAGILSEVVIPLAVAILLAAMLSPVANRLHGWGLPRVASTAITVLGGLVLIAGALTLIGTQIASQAGTLSTNVVEGYNQLIAYLQNGPLHVSASVFDTSKWGTRISAFLKDSQSTITTYAGEIGTQVGHFVAGFFITIFSLFYFLYEGRKIFTFLLKFFPRESRAKVDEAALKGWVSLSHYVRATILVALSDAVGVLIAALILGVPVAPALAALVFIGAFVPLVGAFVSGFVAVLVALVALGWIKALIMFGAIILVMQVEGHLLQPLLLGRAVKLHPLAVLLAIAIGIILGGIVGALMAVPLLAFTKSFTQYLAGQVDPPISRVRWPARNVAADSVSGVPSLDAPEILSGFLARDDGKELSSRPRAAEKDRASRPLEHWGCGRPRSTQAERVITAGAANDNAGAPIRVRPRSGSSEVPGYSAEPFLYCEKEMFQSP